MTIFNHKLVVLNIDRNPAGSKVGPVSEIQRHRDRESSLVRAFATRERFLSYPDIGIRAIRCRR